MPLLAPGSDAPDFAIISHTGEMVRLGDFADNYVLLWFFPRADTPGCTTQACALRDGMKELRDLGAVIVGASFDTPDDNRAFASTYDLPFVLLCDTTRDLAVKYGAAADKDAAEPLRVSYLIAPDGTIACAFRDVDPARHARDVAQQLAAMVGDGAEA